MNFCKFVTAIGSMTLGFSLAASATENCALYELKTPWSTNSKPARPYASREKLDALDAKSSQEFNSKILPILQAKGYRLITDEEKASLANNKPVSATVYSLYAVVYHPTTKTAGYQVSYDLTLYPDKLSRLVSAKSSRVKNVGEVEIRDDNQTFYPAQPAPLTSSKYEDVAKWFEEQFPSCNQVEGTREQNRLAYVEGGDHVSVTGAVFKQVNDAALGDAYLDPSGLILWASETNRDYFFGAYSGCMKGPGVRLPTEDEWMHLASDLGNKGVGFSAFTKDGRQQVIPNLGEASPSKDTMHPWQNASPIANDFWTATRAGAKGNYTTIFQFGVGGSASIEAFSPSHHFAYKCVREVARGEL